MSSPVPRRLPPFSPAMSRCTSSPTLTSLVVGTTQFVSTTVSASVTTPPGSVITTVVGTCATISDSATCGSATRVVTEPATPFTTFVQVEVTLDVPYTFATTLYGSSCSLVPIITHRSSPVVSTLTTSSAYTSDGITYVTIITSVSSAPPSQSTSASPAELSHSNNTDSSHLPAIIGGAVGGLSVLALLAIVAWKFFKKPRASMDQGPYTNFNDLTKQDQGSAPYHYSAVGQQEAKPFSNGTGLQPTAYGNGTAALHNGVAGGGDTFTQYTGSTSNGVGPGATGNVTGLPAGVSSNDVMYNTPNHSAVHKIPIPSLTPLAAGAGAIAGARPALNSDPTSSYISGSDPTGRHINYSSNLGYTPQQYQSQSGLSPYPQQPYGPPPLQGQGQRPLTSLSVGSTTTMSTSGPMGSGTGPSVDFMPSLMTQPGQVYPSQAPYGQQPHGDSLSASQSVGSAGPVDRRASHPGHDTFLQDPLTAPRLGSSSSTSIDGKGRTTQGEKAAIVHLDGAAYDDSSNTAPPAYQE